MRTIILLCSCSLTFVLTSCLLQEEPYEPAPLPESLLKITAGYFPAISPDGTKLAYSRNGAIFISDTNGSKSIQLTDGSFDDIYPRWSSDGRKIGFIRKDKSKYGYGILMTLDTLNKAAVQLCSTDAVYYTYLERALTKFSKLILDWSPTNDKIAFISGSDTLTKLIIVSGDGSGTILGRYTLNVTKGEHVWDNRSGFCWSPTGNQLACTSNFYSDTSFLYTITVGADTMIKTTSSSGACFPYWTPDGNIISYQSDYSNYTLYDFTTKFQNRLYASYSPKLSPNAKKIVYYSYYYNSNPDGASTSEYMVTDVSTGFSDYLVRTGYDYYFVWHPSSKYIYYDEVGVIYRVDIPE